MVTAAKLTYQDYLNTPGDERYELIDGELIMVPAPSTDHQGSQVSLGSKVFLHTHEHGLGRVFLAPTDVVLSDTDTVQPDVLFISKEREHIITPANIQGAPDFVVEILSPSNARYDWREKRELYAKHRVKEYWIVDPVNRMVWVMLLRAGVLEIEGIHGDGDTVSSTTLAGFTIKVSEIF